MHTHFIGSPPVPLPSPNVSRFQLILPLWLDCVILMALTQMCQRVEKMFSCPDSLASRMNIKSNTMHYINPIRTGGFHFRGNIVFYRIIICNGRLEIHEAGMNRFCVSWIFLYISICVALQINNNNIEAVHKKKLLVVFIYFFKLNILFNFQIQFLEALTTINLQLQIGNKQLKI